MRCVLMMTAVAAAMCLSLGAFAQDTTLIKISCEGVKEMTTTSVTDSNVQKTRDPTTFSLRVDPATGLAEADGIGILAVAADPSRPFAFNVTDAALQYHGEHSK